MTMDDRLNFCLPTKLLEALNAWAAEYGLNRSEAARLLLHRAIGGQEPYRPPALPNWQTEAWTSLLRGLFGSERLVLTTEVKVLLVEAVAALDERGAQVITRRFGLNGPRYTLRETGTVFGVNRQRAHQVEVKALRRMRFYLARSGIWELLEPQLDKEQA